MISSIPKWMSDLFEGSLRPNMKVLNVAPLTPHIKKIHFQGDISKMSFQIGYASVLRVSETEFRNYTVAHHDMSQGILDIIFHIHGNGVGSQLIDALEAGDELYIGPSRGIKQYNPSIKQQLIFGDETSLGLACSFQSVLKKNDHQFQFYFELDEENKETPQLLGLENCTVFPKNGSFRNEKWISNLPVFQTLEWHSASFALTGNVKSVQAFRNVLKNKTKGKISSQGYWLEGKKGL
jgi:NADPH-dependent ferric siderophore reductase